MDTFSKMLAFSLYEVGAVNFGAFKLKMHEKHPEAPLSPIYLNLRTPDNKDGPLQTVHVNAITHCMRCVSENAKLSYSVVAGVPYAGDPFATAFVQRSECGLIRLDKTRNGDKRCISEVHLGAWEAGSTVLVIDDLITQADSKIECIRALEQGGLHVKDVLVLVDREQGGREQLAKLGYTLHSVFTLTELLEFYVTEGKISPEKRDEVLTYVRENS